MEDKRPTKTEVCESKKVYQNLDDAWSFSGGIFRKYGHYNTPYKCKVCKKYHLTSKRPDVPPSKKFKKRFNKWFGSPVL